MSRLFAVVLLFLALPTQANATGAGDFQTVLQNLKTTYQNAGSWQADFTQSTHVELLGRDVAKSGEMFLKKPGKLRIAYKGGKTYISNNQRLWIYTEGDSQVEFYKNVSSVLSREALAFLQGLGELDRDFKVRPASSGTKNHLRLVELTPKAKNSPVQKIILGVSITGVVKETILFNASGNKTHYVFKNIRLNMPLADPLFEFTEKSLVWTTHADFQYYRTGR